MASLLGDAPQGRVSVINKEAATRAARRTAYLAMVRVPGVEPATRAALRVPYGVAVDRESNVYIADSGNNRIRRVDPAGRISTIAGTGVKGYGGDNGPATAARLNHPEGVAPDRAGNVYIADSSNNRVRKVDRAGRIITVAGTGASAFSGDRGPAAKAEPAYPVALAADDAGNIYISDLTNGLIRRLDAATGGISSFAGIP